MDTPAPEGLTLPGRGSSVGDSVDDVLFENIAQNLEHRGFSITPGALPPALADALCLYGHALPARHFQAAGIGRGAEFKRNTFVRSDAICWITGEHPVCADWLHWCGQLQRYLNRRLFLGLFSFESHFAHYQPGDFYRRHYDAFRGESNRVLSVVAYLNPGWGHNEGGELVLYGDDIDRTGIKVVPLLGTLVVFLSEEFPHEVLPASRSRLSIAGWYRLNTSVDGRVDPPR